MKNSRIFLLLIVFTFLLFPLQQVQSAAPSSYDLLAAVNSLRQSNGLPAIETNEILMVSAQIQSDYLGSTYGTDSPGPSEGHVGAGGTSELDRAVSVGYPVGPSWYVDEIWAKGNNGTTAEDAVYEIWNNSDIHRKVILNPDNVHMGAGVTEGDGYVYFIVVFGIDFGSGGSSNGGVASTIPTTAVTPNVAPVTVATPKEDGSIIHEVEIGQALWSIAAAYEVTLDQLYALNNLSAGAVIYEGQTLLVQLAYTPTPSPTTTQTPRPPTRTPIPAQTAQAVKTQASKSEDSSNSFLGLDRQTMGLALILICGIGLVLIVVGTMAKDKRPKPPQSE